MKLKLLLITALLFGLSSYSFAQDTPPPDLAVEVHKDAGPAVDAMPVAEATAPAPTPKPITEATAPAEETALSKLSTEIMNILIPVFSTLILGLATMMLNWVRKKFKLEVSDRAIYQWSLVAQKAAARGGEWAHNKAKELTDGEKVPGPEVLEVAVDWAVMVGKQYGLPDMGREKLIGLIEGHIHTERKHAALAIGA